MAITSQAGIIAGLRPQPLHSKVSATSISSSATLVRGLTDWYLSGTPAASTANTSGLGGQATSLTLGNTVNGMLPRNNPATGQAYIGRLNVRRGAATSGIPTMGSLMIVDRLWHNSSLSATATTAQAITPAALPARDVIGSTNGEGVMAAIEWSTAGGVGTPTVTLTYTNQAGTTGQTTSIPVVASPNTGCWELFPLAAGDTGIRAITSYQASATRTSGTFHLVLYRILAIVPLEALTQNTIMDAINLGMPKLYSDTVLQTVLLSAQNTHSAGLNIQYTETHG